MDDFLDVILFLTNLRIVIAVHAHYYIYGAAQEFMIDAQQPSVTDSPAQHPAQDVAPAQVGRQDAVADHKSQAPGMVRNHLQGNVGLRGSVVGHAADLAGIFNDGENQIRFKVGRLSLQHRGNTLQTGACINIFVFQRRVGAVFVLVELGEHQVPQFQETPAVAVRAAVRFATSPFRA